MVTREQALAFIMQHQRIAERDFLELARDLFRKNAGVIPPHVRAKFLAAGGSYGEFKINQDWRAEMEAEVWDGVMYAGLARMKKEMTSPATSLASSPFPP